MRDYDYRESFPRARSIHVPNRQRDLCTLILAVCQFNCVDHPKCRPIVECFFGVCLCVCVLSACFFYLQCVCGYLPALRAFRRPKCREHTTDFPHFQPTHMPLSPYPFLAAVWGEAGGCDATELFKRHVTDYSRTADRSARVCKRSDVCVQVYKCE